MPSMIPLMRVLRSFRHLLAHPYDTRLVYQLHIWRGPYSLEVYEQNLRWTKSKGKKGFQRAYLSFLERTLPLRTGELEIRDCFYEARCDIIAPPAGTVMTLKFVPHKCLYLPKDSESLQRLECFIWPVVSLQCAQPFGPGRFLSPGLRCLLYQKGIIVTLY